LVEKTKTGEKISELPEVTQQYALGVHNGNGITSSLNANL
jgi:hypothetical protein